MRFATMLMASGGKVGGTYDVNKLFAAEECKPWKKTGATATAVTPDAKQIQDGCAWSHIFLNAYSGQICGAILFRQRLSVSGATRLAVRAKKSGGGKVYLHLVDAATMAETSPYTPVTGMSKEVGTSLADYEFDVTALSGGVYLIVELLAGQMTHAAGYVNQIVVE